MEVADVESHPIEIPLDSPVSFSTWTITYRDHAITHVQMTNGREDVVKIAHFAAHDVSLDEDTLTSSTHEISFQSRDQPR
jgi:D-arabinonate dehydratase